MRPNLKTEGFWNMAHRGASAVAPANTFAAFEAAVQMGANVIETDVHWTRDNVLVVAHDDTVDAVSNGSGRIAEMNYKDLLALDFGYRFTLDEGKTFPFRGQGVRIPTFYELLSKMPGIRINVDLKPEIAHVSSFLRVVARANAMHRVVLASFHHRTLVEARQRCPELATSASTREVVQFLLGLQECSILGQRKPVSYVALQVPHRFWGHQLVNARFVRRAKRQGVAVHVWTVDHPADMERLIALGVNGIVTNEPNVLKAVLAKQH